MSIRRNIIQRSFQITFQLTKHLGGYLLSAILRRLWPRAKFRQKHSLLSDISRATRIRMFLQDVDGVFIKIGQIMAMRVDFLSDEYIQELLKLLDEVPPFDPQLAKEIIEEELESKISVLFRTFEEEPIAAASFGQVHAATLQNGDEVVIKVQRPEVPDIVAADLRLLRLGTFLIDATGLTKRVRLKHLYDDFSEWTKEELDYRIEGSHVQRLYEEAIGSENERIPKVYWNLTSTRILTLERLRGIWVKEIIERLQTDRISVTRELSRRNTTLMEVSRNILQNSLRQIFDYGFYHADPHAANLLVMENGVIGYVDFGITGQLREKAKALQVKVHVALESGDVDRFYGAVLEMIDPPHDADLARFEKAVRRSFAAWTRSQYMGTVNIREKSFARLMLRLSDAAQRSWVAFSSMEVRIFRTLAIVDAVLLQFAPNLNVRSEFRKFFTMYEVKKRTHSLPTIIHNLPMALHNMSLALHNMPQEISEQIATVSTYVSKVKTVLSRIFQIGSFLLIPVALTALIEYVVRPKTGDIPRVGQWLTDLRGGPLYLAIIAILAILFFGWLSRLLRLRSIIRRPIVKNQKH